MNLPIHEYEMSLNSLISLISFTTVRQFPYVDLERILLNVQLNILISGANILTFGLPIDFWTVTFYPTTLLKSTSQFQEGFLQIFLYFYLENHVTCEDCLIYFFSMI